MEQSLLASLSAELRNSIYEYTVVQRTEITIKAPHRTHDGQISSTKVQSHTFAVPQIFRTCRQIRDECRLMYYASNTFRLQCDAWRSGGDINWIERWLDAIGSNARKALKNVHVDLGHNVDFFGHPGIVAKDLRAIARQIGRNAPQIARLAYRLPASDVRLSCIWIVDHQADWPAVQRRHAVVKMEGLRLFQSQGHRVVPLLHTPPQALSNSAVVDVPTALLVGYARKQLVGLIRSVWTCLVYYGAETCWTEVASVVSDLETALWALDEGQAYRWMAGLSDDLRGYST